MELLILLVGRRGELVSREEIIEKLWGREVFIETEHGINTAVRKIRQTLGDDPERPTFVQTVVGKGYRFCAVVRNGDSGPVPTNELQLKSEPESGAARASEPAGSGGERLGTKSNGAGSPPLDAGKGPIVPAAHRLDPEKPSEASAKRSYMTALFTAGIAAVVIAGLLVSLTHFPPRRPLLNQRITIAVLPFTNLSGDAGQEYLSDGMTEEVITAIGQVNGERLGVIARTSAMRYKHTDHDVRQIGRELGADYILEGSVRSTGDRIRVTTQLVDARDQTNLWSHDYDSLGFNEIPGVQTQIRDAVAKALRLETDPKPGSAKDVQAEAYQLYLKGRYFLDRRDPGSLKKALDYFQKATSRDEKFARGWASVALSYELLEYVRSISPSDAYPNALLAAKRAVQIDPQSPEGHTALGYIHEHYEWNWAEADRELTEALKLDPSYELARQWYSYELLQRGNVERALAEMRRALTLDPVSFRVNASMAERLERAGLLEEAIRQYLTALELSPDDSHAHAKLGELYGKKADTILAAKEYRRSLELGGNQNLEKQFDELNGRKGFAAAFSAIEAERFRLSLHELNVRAGRGEYVSPSDYAVLYILLDDRKRALKWLERACNEHASLMLELNDPIFDKVRDANEFKEFERRVNMPTIRGES